MGQERRPTPAATRLDEATPAALAPFAAACLLAGLSLQSSGPFGFTPAGVVEGIAGQLATTLPAAILVAAASVLNMSAGAVLVRAISGRPLGGLSGAILGGFLGAVLLDLVLFGALGGTGAFRWPVLVAVHLAILAAGTRLRPIVIVQRPLRGDWWPAWVIVALSWVGLIALQLASPVVPFVDVLPNHVAPVEHLRTFGEFATLTTTASPIYGPSRTFLGYVATLGVIDTLSGLPAALGVAAFALPGAIAVAAGVHRLGSVVGGGRTGTWAVVTFALTTSFVRLPDARATVLVLPLACWCLATVADRLAGSVAEPRPKVGPIAGPTTQPKTRPPALGEVLLLGAAIAAAVLFHPVIGALTALTCTIVTLALPERAGTLGVPALATAGILALPQVATMVELTVPTALALLVIPPGLAAGWLLSRLHRIRRGLILSGRVAVGLAAIGAVALTPLLLPAAERALSRILPTMPVLLVTIAAGALVAPRRLLTPRRLGSPVLVAMLVGGAIVATATEVVPAEGTLLAALRFEVPKTLHYWLPVGIALAAAIALDGVWRDEGRRLPAFLDERALPRLALTVFVIAAFLPMRAAPLTDAYHLGERRVSETVALQLRYAEVGYWQGYPDPRRIVDPERVALLDAVRAEIGAGRLGPASEVLHVARSFQQWSAVPLGVFVGVIETDVTPDAEVSIHTVGGRLRRFADLGSQLARRPPYVVLEPAELPPGTRDAIVAAGYQAVFANDRGELFRLGS
jgi:hypothetical protein